MRFSQFGEKASQIQRIHRILAKRSQKRKRFSSTIEEGVAVAMFDVEILIYTLKALSEPNAYYIWYSILDEFN